jgi:hypothetical protein
LWLRATPSPARSPCRVGAQSATCNTPAKDIPDLWSGRRGIASQRQPKGQESSKRHRPCQVPLTARLCLAAAVPAPRVFDTSTREPLLASLRWSMVCRGKSRARSASRAGITTRLLHSASLRASPEQRARRIPLRTPSVPARDLRTANHGSLRSQSWLAALATGAAMNRSPPDLLQWGAAHSLNRAPVRLWRPETCPVLDNRPAFGIIWPMFLTQGLLGDSLLSSPTPGAPFILRSTPKFLEAFAHLQSGNFWNFRICPLPAKSGLVLRRALHTGSMNVRFGMSSLRLTRSPLCCTLKTGKVLIAKAGLLTYNCQAAVWRK